MTTLVTNNRSRKLCNKSLMNIHVLKILQIIQNESLYNYTQINKIIHFQVKYVVYNKTASRKIAITSFVIFVYLFSVFHLSLHSLTFHQFLISSFSTSMKRQIRDCVVVILFSNSFPPFTFIFSSISNSDKRTF